MKSQNKLIVRYNCLRNSSIFSILAGVILLFTSCTSKPYPYSILEIAGDVELLNNYSKSSFLTFYQPDSVNPTAMVGSMGDLFTAGGYIFLFNETTSQNRFLFKLPAEGLYINGKIISISIPDDEDLIPWFENMNERDFSSLQFISFSPKMPESYLPYLSRLAEIKPDVGFLFDGNFGDMAELLKLFKPRYLAGPDLVRSDYNLLSGLPSLEILMISLEDSVIADPLPSLPELKQLLLTELDEDLVLTNNFLINNKQIERVIIQKPGSFDFSILEPLINLKELVIRESDTIINFDLINNHKKLEVLLLGDDKPDVDLTMIRLPSLRWMTFFENVTQEEFNSFIDSHPDLEMIELIANDTIRSLKALSKLTKLFGLTIVDTVTDITSVKTLMSLKYLSLPVDFLDDSVNKSELQISLPDTRIVANQGLCLGSGWILLLIPLVLIIRSFGRQNKQSLNDGLKA